MAKRPQVASIWRCDTCGMQLYAVDCPKRMHCRSCWHWMRKVHPR